jgi:hypothetical protein
LLQDRSNHFFRGGFSVGAADANHWQLEIPTIPGRDFPQGSPRISHGDDGAFAKARRHAARFDNYSHRSFGCDLGDKCMPIELIAAQGHE